jgi:hypothetical protein
MSFILRFGTAHAFLSLITETKPMTSSTQDERWKELCQAIVEESDSNRLMELVHKLNRVLEERENKLQRRSDEQALGQAGDG